VTRIKSGSRFTVRIANPSDTLLIARLCRRAVSRYDYILRRLPAVVSRGGLFLAWNSDELVGMTNFEKSIDGNGWLSMARTDPVWRRRGVATFLQREIAAHAKRRGVRALRLWVSSWNTPSLKACESGGFRRVCEAAHLSCRIRARKKRRKISSSHPAKVAMRLLLKSRYVAKTGGYIGYKRHFVKLTENLLIQLRNEHQVYLTEGSALLVSRPERIFREPQSSVVILHGPTGKSLSHAKEIAQGLGARILSYYTPYSAHQISIARTLGFRSSLWGKHCIVFEKKI
jgi:GNAT superfamily N-acetyltransferase